ncbi:allantoicase [Nocardia terpenica]|uniref:allantoicase n=1 Tax=Nocardia terpenica TaxID=455432 RepID=UPI0018960A55|nr:allantoicase [Nocardia terpenica]MBF6065251.1 allantoicase [Nocardia terpenica]MBF6107978.1 allantoicase [Nocardia terpenica]MBF6115491.1 allantoicase [Nocardia terpenica]MBF6121928.1 allantoicase [Nocardia terpenica]MBF6155528.1 allantoicase [Nocardia terpenica]
MTGAPIDFTLLPDLAQRPLGGAVIWANDESFAEKENLIRPEAATFTAATFGHKGQVYDGWETRRRRRPGGAAPGPEDCDEAVVRLGVPGVVHGVVVDTAWFTGNYPPEISVEGLVVDGYPAAAEIAARTDWFTLVERAKVNGDAENPFPVESARRVTHVRLRMYPDGGVARLRVHGTAKPDLRWLDSGPFDLAALENGGRVVDCSNRFYSHPQNLLLPGRARVMGDGWETARRRDGGNDWVRVLLAGESVPGLVEIDTSYFLSNSPGAARLTGFRADGGEVELLPRTDLLPDTRHRFAIAAAEPVTEIRLDVYPDGGFARLRLFGTLTAAARDKLRAEQE